MAFQPVPGGVQVRMFFLQDEEECENHFFVETADPGDEARIEAFAGVFATAWATHLAPVTSNEAALMLVRCTDESAQDGVKVDYGDDLPLPGLLASPVVANSVTKAHQLRTGRKGRSFLGRWYFVGLSNADVQSNQVTTRILTGQNNFIADVRLGLAANGGTLAVCSRQYNKVERPTGILTPVRGWGWANNTSDTMRTRNP